MFAVDNARANTLPVNVSQIQLRFISSPTSTRAAVRQAQLSTICDGIVTCITASTSNSQQPVPGCSTKSSSPPVCHSLQTFQSKSTMTTMSPAVCLAALRSQVNMLLNSSAAQSPSESSSSPAESSGTTRHAKSSPVPMSASPPSTCIRPKVLAPNPQTSVAVTSPSLMTGVRPVRPIQPLPPVRTSSCPMKVIPGSKPADEVYEQVPMHEPDLSRQPSRSALKGSKSTGSQSFQQQLEKVLGLTQKQAGCQPFSTDPASDAVINTGLCRSRSGDCGKLTAKSLPAVPPKPKLM